MYQQKSVGLEDRDFIISRCCSPALQSFDDLYDTGFHISRHVSFNRYESNNPCIYWISDRLKKDAFSLKYNLKELIDEGTYAKVYKCSPNNGSDKEYAVKILNKTHMRAMGIGSFIEREIQIMKLVKEGSHICQLIDFVETSTHYYLVMELLSGGTLDREFYLFEEYEYKAYAYQLAKALQHLHGNGIFHADVQLGNICKVSSDPSSLHVKLVDFGMSDFIVNDKSLTRNVGNLYHASPEMLNKAGYNGPEVDVWAFGVCLFKMATGYRPFKNSESIRNGEFMIPLEEESCSDECKDLILRTLDMDPDTRLTIDEVLSHPFFDECRNVDFT